MSRQARRDKKQSRRTTRRSNKQTLQDPRTDDFSAPFEYPVTSHAFFKPKPLSARNEAQGHAILAIENHPLTFLLGPAGTGKSYLAVSLAIEALENKSIDKIIITRPAVEACESLGFLPGELDEKFEPFFAPVRDIFHERLGPGHTSGLIKSKRIEARPLAHMRGSTLKNAFVILDEAQNTTPAQMKMFLTRIGENARVVVDGDLAQSDIAGPSGLADAVTRLRRLNKVAVVEFTEDDIVRSGLVRDILKAYRG